MSANEADLQATRSARRERLRTDMEERRRFLREAVNSFAFEGIAISWEDAERALHEVLETPAAEIF